MTTCLSANRSSIECCPTPYTFDENDECVIQCPLTIVPPITEENICIIYFVFVWTSTLALLIATLPVLSTQRFKSFPHYLFCLVILCEILSAHSVTFAFYSGGTAAYLCAQNTNFLIAFYSFIASNRCLLQIFFFTVCTSSTCYWGAILTALIFRQFYQTLHNSDITPFTTLPPFTLHIIGWSFALCVSVPILIVTYLQNGLQSDGESLVNILPGVCACFPAPRGVGLLLYTTHISLILFSFAMIIGCVIELFYMGIDALFAQLRILTFITLYILPFLFYVATLLKAVYLRNYTRLPYAQCVASHPRDTDPPCPVEYAPNYGLDLFTLMLLSLWGLSVSVMVYFTNPTVYQWWLVRMGCMEEGETITTR